MTRPAFLDALRAGALVFDGAMGTALYERGLLYTRSLDEASRSHPEVVRAVHAAYVAAGAQVLLTNTFGANRYRLEPHGLAGDVDPIVTAAVKLARETIGARGYVLGSVGPTGLMLKTLEARELEAIEEAFVEPCAVLAREGVDGIIFETFRQPEELELGMRAARRVAAGVPIVASVSFDAFGTAADGTGPAELAARIAGGGADALGVNCSDGPAGVYEMATRMLDAGLPLVAMPNAGLPRRVEGRLAYWATPEYFQLYAKRLFKAGVHGVGGCCGTTAEHIKKIASAARMRRGAAQAAVTDEAETDREGGARDLPSVRAVEPAPGCTVARTSEKGRLGALLGVKPIVSVEVNPPPGLSIDKALAGARMLHEAGVDVINVADGARASARMGNLALCLRIQRELQMPTLMHVTTRDRNVLGLVAHLLAAHELDVRNLVVITGDPPKMGDFPDATAVYDMDSIGLLRLIRGLNHGFDPGGKPLDAATRFLCATGAEPAARDYPLEIARLIQKIEAGAELIMTQPVYDPAVLDRFLGDVAPFNVPVLVGLLPLASYRNAEFLHNEVPGMQIPDEIRRRMKGAGSGAAGRAEGVAIAREMLSEVRDRVAGAYIMPPFGRYELALRVVEGLLT